MKINVSGLYQHNKNELSSALTFQQLVRIYRIFKSFQNSKVCLPTAEANNRPIIKTKQQ